MSTLTSDPELVKVTPRTARKSTTKLPQCLIKETNFSELNINDRERCWANPIIKIEDSFSLKAVNVNKKSTESSRSKKDSETVDSPTESSSHNSNIFSIFNDRTKWTKDSNQKRLSDSGGQSSMISSLQNHWNDSQIQRLETLTNSIGNIPSSPDSKINPFLSARKSVNPARIAQLQAEEISKLQEKVNAMQERKKVTNNINGSIDSHGKNLMIDSLDIIVELSDSETEQDNIEKSCTMESTCDAKANSDSQKGASNGSPKSLASIVPKPLFDDEKRKDLQGLIMNAISKVGLQGKTLAKKCFDGSEKLDSDHIEQNGDHADAAEKADDSCDQTINDSINNSSSEGNLGVVTAELEASLLADDDEKVVDGDDNQEINDDLLNDDEVLNDETSSTLRVLKDTITDESPSLNDIDSPEENKTETVKDKSSEVSEKAKDEVELKTTNEEGNTIKLQEETSSTATKENSSEQPNCIGSSQSSETIIPGIEQNSESKISSSIDSATVLDDEIKDENIEEINLAEKVSISESTQLLKENSPKKRPLSPSELEEVNDSKKIKLDSSLFPKSPEEDNSADILFEHSIDNNEHSDLKISCVESEETSELKIESFKSEPIPELKMALEDSDEIAEIKIADIEMVEEEEEGSIKIVSIESEQVGELKIAEIESAESIDFNICKEENEPIIELKIASIVSETNSELIESDEEAKVTAVSEKIDNNAILEPEITEAEEKTKTLEVEMADESDCEKSTKRLKLDEVVKDDDGKKEPESLDDLQEKPCESLIIPVDEIKINENKVEITEETSLKAEVESALDITTTLEVAEEETKEESDKLDELKEKSDFKLETADIHPSSPIAVMDDDADIKICSPKTERFLSKKSLAVKITNQMRDFMENSNVNQSRALKKRIEDLERIIVTWRTTTQELQKQVLDLNNRLQRTEKRRPLQNKIQYRNVGIQVTHTRILNTAQQQQQMPGQATVLSGSQGGTMQAGIPQRLTVLSGGQVQGSNQVIPMNSQGGNPQLSTLLNNPPNSNQPILMTASTAAQGNRPGVAVPNSVGKPIVYQIVSSAPSRLVTTAPVQAMGTNLLPVTGTTSSITPVPLVTTANPSNQYVMVNMANSPANNVATSTVQAMRQDGQPITMVTNMSGNQQVVPQQLVPNIAASRTPGTVVISQQVKLPTNDNSQKQIIDLTNDEDERPMMNNQRMPVVVTGRSPVAGQGPTPTGMIRAGPPPLISNQQTVRVVGPPQGQSPNVRPGQPTTIYVRSPAMSLINTQNQRPTYLVTQNVVQSRQTAPAVSQSGPVLRAPNAINPPQYRPPMLTPQPVQQNRPIMGTAKPPPLLQQPGSSQVRTSQPQPNTQSSGFSNVPPATSPNIPNLKRLPPKPSLKISRVDSGIVLSWNMNLSPSYAKIASYQLYAYQEGNTPPNTALWKKVGDVKALPLPMACTLTQFVEGHKYHFAVRAVDVHGRLGPLSDACSIHLTSTQHH